MPCATYDRNGKLLTVLAGPREMPDTAKFDAAVADPETKFAVICKCEDAHQGLADATECDTIHEGKVMVFRPDEPLETTGDYRPRRRKRRRRRKR